MFSNSAFSSTGLPSKPAAKEALVQEIQGLLGDRDKSDLRRLWNLRRDHSGFSVNRKRKICNSSREKMAFAISWLSEKIFWKQRKKEFAIFTAMPSLATAKDHNKLNKYREQCLRSAISILHDLGYIGPHKKQIYVEADQKDLLKWFVIQRKEDINFFSMPEMFEEDLRGSQLDERVERLNELPRGYLEQWRSEEYLLELKEINGLIRRIVRRLRCSPKMSQRELSNALRVTLPRLRPALEILESIRIITWDRQGKSVSTDRWDPKDKRKFVWLHDSAWPRFGPQLQKDKVHKFSDYNRFAAEEWIRTGAASPC